MRWLMGYILIYKIFNKSLLQYAYVYYKLGYSKQNLPFTVDLLPYQWLFIAFAL